jgi:pyridinium-3,5-biscarboxylic acid mononucleotide sulfurtransferase
MSKLDALSTHIASLGRVVLGYSGGVDSALLAVVGARTAGPDRFLAVIGQSPSYPAAQYDNALAIAAQFEIPLLIVDTRELNDPRYVANPVNRCYFCKTELWSVLRDIAAERGYDTVIDGTNADDLREHRPGLRAAEELGIRSPLSELGWSKSMVRAAAEELGLPTWDQPASPCLSSRIQYGLSVTPERLRQVELGESFLRSLGISGDLRVRHHGAHARIEADSAGQKIIRDQLSRIEAYFHSLGLEKVEIDPAGYRRGSLLHVLSPAD